MTREQVRDLMFSANTLAKCRVAWEAREAYLLEHPEEWELFLDAGSTLTMLEKGLERLEAGRSQELVHAA